MTGVQPVPTGTYWNDPSTVSAFAALPAPAYLTDLLTGPVPDGATALDAGCGTGRNLPSLISAGYRVLAVDLHPGMLDQARARYAGPRVTFVNATITSIPAADQQASLVVCHGVLHNLHRRDELAAGLYELRRVLAVGGTLSLNTFTAGYLDPCLSSLGDDVYALPNGQFMTLLPPDELVRLIRSAGLSLHSDAAQYLRPGDPGQRSVWRATLTRV
ncbi:class I SAM-dependent methyltransferase [Dactylosporangium sp. NPDC051485]|uniref:class I SAM-dependent methyltransferase n=1 Tax=Dactylosporangium sp. NPDC051485 TaxID=3154846 RepID=UPI003418BBF8